MYFNIWNHWAYSKKIFLLIVSIILIIFVLTIVFSVFFRIIKEKYKNKKIIQQIQNIEGEQKLEFVIKYLNLNSSYDIAKSANISQTEVKRLLKENKKEYLASLILNNLK